MGKLTPEQSLWFRDTKPAFELFDTKTDPHEVNNLADDPAYKEKIEELSNALDTWIENTNDRGMLDEKKYLESIWPGLQQPQTANPTVIEKNGKISIECATPGASIAYQRSSDNTRTSKNWQVYQDAFSHDGKDTIKIVAHRIGYLPSETIIIPSSR